MSNPTRNTRYRPAATTALERASRPSACGCCGREDLLRTVKMIGDDGGVVWMGTGCAAKAMGVGVAQYRKAAEREQAKADERERAARAMADRAEDERWQSWLDKAAGPRVPCRFERWDQIKALGGGPAARAAYQASLRA